MSRSPTHHKIDLENKRIADEQAKRQAKLDHADQTYAARIIALWNARAADGRRRPSFYPTILAALTAKMPYVTSVCPGCWQATETDLRTLDRHPEATIATLIPTVSCSRCGPHAPFARLLKLSAGSQRFVTERLKQ